MVFATSVATLLAGIAAWCLWRFAKNRVYYDMHKIPGPKPWPILGNLRDIIGTSHLHKVHAGWAKRYGSIVKWHLGPTAVLLVTDPDEVVKLVGKEAKLPKWPVLYDLLNTRAPHYSMLGTPDYEEWRYFRKLTNPAFSPDNMRKVFPQVLQPTVRAAEVTRQICKTALVDIDAIAMNLTADIIMKAGFDHDMKLLQTETLADGSVRLMKHEYLQYSKEHQDNMNLMFVNPMLAFLVKLVPWHPQAKKARAAGRAVAEHEDELVALIKQQGVQPEDNTALWACLGRAVNYKDGSPIHHDTLATNAGLFFGAGYESTAHACTWALFEVAANQELQAAVQDELKAAGLMASLEKSEPRDLEFADLTKLPLLDGVVRETLRLHGTLPLGSVRVTVSDMVICGYRVPAGTPVAMTSFPLHISEDNYANPNQFRPERWIQSQDEMSSVDKGHPDATTKGHRLHGRVTWNPFSNGPRNCIGQSLAMQELRTVLAIFLSKFKLELPDGVSRDRFLEEEQVLWISLQPRTGLPLKVTPIGA